MQPGVPYEAIVIDVEDPQKLGRMRARVIGAEKGYDQTPWIYPTSPIGGPSYGFYFLPVPGDKVLIEQSARGTWFCTGYFWTKDNPKPDDGSANVRVLRTPTGHQLKFDESGDVEIKASNGSRITLKPNGNIEVFADGDVHLNGSSGKVVTTDCICCLTGGPHPQGSLTVKAKGIA